MASTARGGKGSTRRRQLPPRQALALSRQDYFERQLRRADAAGYKAAGVLFVRRRSRTQLEALLGRKANTDGLVTEGQLRRDGVGELWTLGGKRELHSERESAPSLPFGQAMSSGDKRRRKEQINEAIARGGVSLP